VSTADDHNGTKGVTISLAAVLAVAFATYLHAAGRPDRPGVAALFALQDGTSLFGRFVAGDGPGMLLAHVKVTLPPLLVVERAGAGAGGTSTYADASVDLLRLLLLGSLFRVVITLTICAARAERRPSRVIVLQASQTLIVLPVAWWPTSGLSATGTALARTIGQAAASRTTAGAERPCRQRVGDAMRPRVTSTSEHGPSLATRPVHPNDRPLRQQPIAYYPSMRFAARDDS